MVLIDSGLPFEHLVVERFEYSPLNGACSDWTVVQLLAGLGDECSAPSVAHLVIEAAAGQRFATAAETHATERRLRADGATGFEVLWSATFSVPLNVVEAAAAFTLLAGDRQPVAVTLPAPVRHDVFVAISQAVEHVFIWAVPAAVVIFVLAWFIKEVPLRGRAPAAEAASQEPELVS